MNSTPSTSDNPDQDFMIKVIQYLEYTYGLVFFINSMDYDLILRWYEKRIPFSVITQSIAQVVQRRKEMKRSIAGFSIFSYQVRKNFKAFMELNIGAEPGEQQDGDNEFWEIEEFFARYPGELEELRSDFESLFQKIKEREPFQMKELKVKLLKLFLEDQELEMKVEVFTRNLAPQLRTPSILGKYRENYLFNKFNIPAFDIYLEADR